ncbi:hypothetical protein [Gordonia liuliyuniae]|uniref:DUF5642 domain-containing protein n=1 Tax=Gordonia liuliyuniae TaxID=2911517 RepID=A0ABS9IRC7_9ACTN|nr:hypothetical protein [Gordonia liuliyuniae]MCF8588109.1 hypothetical protein [Gordonia liuliyuniae]
MRAVVVVAAIALSTVACSVDGDAVRVPDLAPRTVASDAFPFGPATTVPAAQVPNAVADITFTPLRSQNQPADCTPSRVEAQSAQVRVGPAGASGGTMTVMLTRASDTFDDYVTGLRECSDFVLGGTVRTRVTTNIGSVADDTVVSGRTLSSNGVPYARVYEMVAQRADLRLYVQNRYAGHDFSAAERSATRELFDSAYETAFAD